MKLKTVSHFNVGQTSSRKVDDMGLILVLLAFCKKTKDDFFIAHCLFASTYYVEYSTRKVSHIITIKRSSFIPGKCR
jgi:hypothetical protein